MSPTMCEIFTINHNCIEGTLADFEQPEHNGYLWLVVPREQLLDNLFRIENIVQTKIHEQHIKDALNQEHPSFFDKTDQYEMVIFRGVAAAQFDMDIPGIILHPASIVCFDFDNIILTVYDEADPAINKVKEFVRRNSHRPVIDTSSELLYKILHTTIEQMLALRNPLTMQVAEWQRLLLEKESAFMAWNEFMSFKSAIEQLAIWAEDQEDVIEDWQQFSKPEQQQQFNINLNDLSDHIERCIRFVQKLSNNLDMLLQLHYSALSHRNNEVLRVLAIISCVFLPLTLITGVFGMNFENMPILHDHYAYYYTLGGMFLLMCCMLILFRWRRWL